MNTLLEKNLSRHHPFAYDLHPVAIPGNSSKIMICFHGFGDNYQMAEKIKTAGNLEQTVIGFNFPDYGIGGESYDAEKTAFGTIQELLPALYIVKSCVMDAGVRSLDLYGFSAGAGALINMIAVLKNPIYDASLQTIGIHKKEKEAILKALQAGIIILDTPLKSIEEIIDLRGSSPELLMIARHYAENNFRPIDSLRYLDGFNIIVHFQNPDEIIFNRDDDLFIERLRRYNTHGRVHTIIGFDGGHNVSHFSLWKFYHHLLKGF